MFNIGTYSPQNPTTGVPDTLGKPANPTAPSESGFDGASLVRTNGNPLGGVYAQPGRFGNPDAPPQTAPSGGFGSGWTPSFRTDIPGYNSSQYADLGTTNTLAQQLGGNAVQTQNAGGFSGGPPPQNMISFGGTGVLNAGLLAERYAKYDRATADAMTRAELAMMGQNPGTSEADTQGGSLGFASQFTGLPGGTQAIGQGANLGSSMPATAPLTPAAMTTPGSPLGTSSTVTTPPPMNTATTAPPPTVTQAQVNNTGNPAATTNALAQLLQLLARGGSMNQQSYANSNYYPSLPRGFGGSQAMTPQGLQALLRSGFGGTATSSANTPQALQAAARAGSGSIGQNAITPALIQQALRGGSDSNLLSLLLGF